MQIIIDKIKYTIFLDKNIIKGITKDNEIIVIKEIQKNEL